MALAERQMSAMDLLLSVSTMEPRLPVLVSEPENLNPEAPQTNVQPFIKLENVNNANDNQYGESFRVGYSPHQLTTLETSYQANNSCPKSSDERMKALMEITGMLVICFSCDPLVIIMHAPTCLFHICDST